MGCENRSKLDGETEVKMIPMRWESEGRGRQESGFVWRLVSFSVDVLGASCFLRLVWAFNQNMFLECWFIVAYWFIVAWHAGPMLQTVVLYCANSYYILIHCSILSHCGILIHCGTLIHTDLLWHTDSLWHSDSLCHTDSLWHTGSLWHGMLVQCCILSNSNYSSFI